jgi:glycosyltransferase involved in cell wall biosynthesis
VNRNPIHEQLLGPEYPLFAGDVAEVEAILRRLWAEPGLLALAADGLRERALQHTFSVVYRDRLRPLLERSRTTSRRRRTILVAGHDFKFAAPIMRELSARGHDVLIDQWQSHSAHDPDSSAALLARADVVFAEWCLGNAVWYSTHVPHGKRLVVRFHAQELLTEYPGRLDVDALHSMVFVGEHLRDEARTAFDLPPEKLVVVPNAVDPIDLDRPKLPGATFNIGMLGYSPRSKGLARALDLLERVRAVDDRYVLFLKGHMPWDYRWLWERTDERDYFTTSLERIQRSALLRDGVVLDPDGPDVAAWLRKVGTLISMSDNESFHLAVAEAAAAGSQPLIVEWPGARHIYPASWIVPDIATAADRILRPGRRGATKDQIASSALPVVTDRIEQLLVS